MVPVHFGHFTREINEFCTARAQGRTDTDPQIHWTAIKPAVHLRDGPAKDMVDVPPPPHMHVGNNTLNRIHHQDGLAISDQNHQGHTRNIRYHGIAGAGMQYFRFPSGKASLIYRQYLGAMNLIRENQACRLHVPQEDTPVLLDCINIVTNTQTEVQARIVTLAATAMSGKDMMPNTLNCREIGTF